MATVRGRKPKRVRESDRAEDESDPTLADLLSEYGGGMRVRLYRQNEATKRLDYVASLDLVPDLIEEVQREFGGGIYRANLFDGSGKYQRGKGLTFSVVGRPRDTDSAILPAGRTRTDELLERLLTQQERGGLTQGVELVTSLMTAMVPLLKPTAEAASGGDVVQTMKLVSDAEARGEARGRELGQLSTTVSLGAGGAPRDSLGAVVAANFPSVISLLREKMAREDMGNAAAAAATTVGPATNPPSPAAAPRLPEGESDARDSSIVMYGRDVPVPEGFEWLGSLRPYFPYLVGEAQRDVAPDLVVEYALSRLSADAKTAVGRSTARPDFIPVMNRELAPLLERHPEWTAEFIVAIVHAFVPDEDEDDVAVVKPLAKRGKKKS